jgi:AcrR family transcriptional regulator
MTAAIDRAVGSRSTDAGDAFRDRLLDGLAASIGERGYRDSTVADIVRHARTSKRTFYELFASKEECLVELLRRNNENLIANIVAAVDPEADWQDQIRQASEAHIASRPAITLSWIRELPALGAVAMPLHRLAMESLTDMLVNLTDSPGFRRAELAPISRPLALILLGGLRELTALFVEDGRDLNGIVEPAYAAATAILGPRG